MVRPLYHHEYENLKWDGVFEGLNMIRIRTPTDGSCYFHSLAKAFFKPYIMGKIDDQPFDRKQFIKNLRKDLSKKLALKVNLEDPHSKTYYETLSKGELNKISADMPEYSLESMQKELNSSSAISHIYNEFISDQLDLDIYILDSENKDVYMTGTEDYLLYKNRRSVVLLYIPGHFELVGILHSNKNIETLFYPNSEIIKKIRKRMKELQN